MPCSHARSNFYQNPHDGGKVKMEHPVVTLVMARNPPNLIGVLLGLILINYDHFGTYPTISRECDIFVTL